MTMTGPAFPPQELDGNSQDDRTDKEVARDTLRWYCAHATHEETRIRAAELLLGQQ